MRSQVYSLLVDNNPGVLSRIAGLFSRRGYSIDSITAGMTAEQELWKKLEKNLTLQENVSVRSKQKHCVS